MTSDLFIDSLEKINASDPFDSKGLRGDGMMLRAESVLRIYAGQLLKLRRQKLCEHNNGSAVAGDA